MTQPRDGRCDFYCLASFTPAFPLAGKHRDPTPIAPDLLCGCSPCVCQHPVFKGFPTPFNACCGILPVKTCYPTSLRLQYHPSSSPPRAISYLQKKCPLLLSTLGQTLTITLFSLPHALRICTRLSRPPKRTFSGSFYFEFPSPLPLRSNQPPPLSLELISEGSCYIVTFPPQ